MKKDSTIFSLTIQFRFTKYSHKMLNCILKWHKLMRMSQPYFSIFICYCHFYKKEYHKNPPFQLKANQSHFYGAILEVCGSSNFAYWTFFLSLACSRIEKGRKITLRFLYLSFITRYLHATKSVFPPPDLFHLTSRVNIEKINKFASYSWRHFSRNVVCGEKVKEELSIPLWYARERYEREIFEHLMMFFWQRREKCLKIYV